VCRSILRCVAVCCKVLQCVAVCCSVLVSSDNVPTCEVVMVESSCMRVCGRLLLYVCVHMYVCVCMYARKNVVCAYSYTCNIYMYIYV